MPTCDSRDASADGAPGQHDLMWAASASVRSFGVRLGVRVNDAALLPRLLHRLPPGSRVCDAARGSSLLYSIVTGTEGAASGARPNWSLYVDDSLEAEVADETHALDAFEARVRFDIARLAARWTFVHAGVVEWNGRAILIPGTSYSGKSRLVEALVRAGAGYYSDEFAALDRRGRVHPFAKPLSIRRDDGGVESVDVRDFGGQHGTRALPVGLVISTRYVPGAEWNPAEVCAGDTVLALLQHAVRAQIAPARVLRTLAEVAETAVTLDGERGEAAEAVRDLLARVPA